MRTIGCIVLIKLIFAGAACAQSTTIETARVLDLFQNQQYDEVINYLAPAGVRDTNDLKVTGFLAYAYLMSDNVVMARKYYQRMFNIDSNNIPALQYLSLSNYTEPPMAIEFTQHLIRLQPAKAAHYRNMGDLLRRGGQKDSALVYYSYAYKLAPTDARNLFGLAEILVDTKQYKPADSLLSIGLERDSLNLSYLALRIRSAYEVKDYQSVIIPGERLVRLGEKTLSPLSNLILSYYNLKMYNDCIRVCEYLLAQGIQVESIYYYEAKSLAKLKDFTKSNELLETCLAIAIKETAEMYYYNLGDNNEALHQYKKATSYYDSAYYLFKNPAMMYNAARVYDSNIHDEKTAKKYYDRYLKTAKPQTADDRKLIEFVRRRLGKK